jgi:ABC-2 type transport system ATP-binding protein
LSGRQNLEFFAALYHIPRQVARRRIDELLAVIGIHEYAGQPFQSYSTGTRHKFDIARGLLNVPQVLFLDEPTRSLDPIATIEVRKTISEYIVGELGRTVLFATHSLTEAQAMCDRVAIIRSGRLVQTGTVTELRGALELGMSCVITVDGTATSLRDRISRIPGVHEVAVIIGDASSEVTVRMDDHDPDLLNRLLATVLESGTRVRSWITHEPTLEEIYRRVLGADAAPTAPASEQA